jgi:hypothetical protein
MVSVVEQGAIRNVVRGIDDVPFHTVLFEPIDDREHSKSRKVFVDMNIRNRTFLIGFENEATEDQITNMVKWHATQGIHGGDNMATAGSGLKYWEYQVRGEHTHSSYDSIEDGSYEYLQSSANTHAIYDAARDTTISEMKFSEINKKNTFYTSKSDEVVPSLAAIFNNTDNAYPFAPKTVFQAKKISNTILLESLNDDMYIETLRRELRNKYFHEVAAGDLELYVKYPKSSTFETIDTSNGADTIGMTIGDRHYVTRIHEVVEGFGDLKKDEYVLEIAGKWFVARPNGSSSIRTQVSVSEENKSKLRYCYLLDQYNIPDAFVKSIEEFGLANTKSMEQYSGIYLNIGGKFNNSRPMQSTLVLRNLQGSKLFRGVLYIAPENARYTKSKLRLNGLKADFNLSTMSNLEYCIKECTKCYKKYCASEDLDKEEMPEKYVCVKSSNEKAKTKEKSGILYILRLGKSFYKLGISDSKSKGKRVFNYYKTDEEYEKIKESFPEETLYPKHQVYFVYLPSYEIKNNNSLEQLLKEQLHELDDVVVYNNKKGEGIREYFHCDSMETLNAIIQFVQGNLNRHIVRKD